MMDVYDDYSSNASATDSDKIDSETEAELYSTIHYEQNLYKCPITGTENIQTLDEMKNEFSVKENEFVKTESVCSKSCFSKNDHDNAVSKFSCESVLYHEVDQKLNLLQNEKSDSNYKCNVSNSQNSEDISVNQTLKNVKDILLNSKRKNDDNLSKNTSSNLVKKNCSGLSDSSDSDCIMWAEDPSDKNEFQTNLYEDIICISSESESESQFNCQPLPKNNKEDCKNISMPNIKIGENIKDLWFINDQDLYRSKRSNSSRYHDNMENTCANCFVKGHNSRICPMPRNIKCFICGGVGHTGMNCVNRMCGKCFDTGHDSRRCWKPYTNFCTLCNIRGHTKENCPDIWRRYHLTTKPGKILRWEVSEDCTFSYCWNCGQVGHFGAVCRAFRRPHHYLHTWPCVISYDDPEDLLRKRSKGCCDTRGNAKRKAHFNQINLIGANQNAEKKIKKKKNKLNQQHNNIKKKAPREKDFPRTPKNKQSSFSEDAVPESVNQYLTKKQKRKENNRRRRLKRRKEFLARRDAIINSLQGKM